MTRGLVIAVLTACAGCSPEGIAGWYGIDLLRDGHRIIKCDIRGTVVSLGCEAEQDTGGLSLTYRLPPGKIGGVDTSGRGIVSTVTEVK